jgi:arylsulfatase
MDRPNILLICVDHWPGRLLGVAGASHILTPTLDKLAHNGVHFTNAYSATPTCVPARRALMTGQTSRTHGDRVFNETLRMNGTPTLPQVLVEVGYQAYAVGKMHVYPQRDRIGFQDVILNEEGRHQFGMLADDYELFLAEQGYTGQELTHAMCNNDYMTRTWHLPEYCHPTNWTVRETCKVIKRRDPSRPGFWYMSFNFPHPPLVPLQAYIDLYRDAEIPCPCVGEWARDPDRLPFALRSRRTRFPAYGPREIELARKAFYAQCTHIDHQIRLVIGMLREEKLLDNTIIGLTCDHGDMLGNHGLYAKGIFYEDSAKIPFILVPTAEYRHLGHHVTDDRLVELRDMMPTLLDLAGVPIPQSVEGMSLASSERRAFLYGEHYNGDNATRMIHDGRHKLIYYACGNCLQLFDLKNDPDELCNVAANPAYAPVRKKLTAELVRNLYGDDLSWIVDGELVGLPDKDYVPQPDRGLAGQRGWRFV